MTLDLLSTIEKAAGAALQTERWKDAQVLFTRYCEAAEALLLETAPGDPNALRISSRVRDYLAWATRLGMAGRAHLAEEARQLPSLGPYAEPANSRPTAGWQVDA